MQISPTPPRGFVTTIPAVPIITGFHPASCIAKGAEVRVEGKNFGTAAGKGVALGGHGIHVDTQVVSWSAGAIVVRIPNDSKIQPDQWYYLGIEQADHAKWLSNINKTITICAATATTPSRLTPPTTKLGSGAFAPPSGDGSQPVPPTGPADGSGDIYPGNGNALPQPSYGTLMNSPLPPVPQVPPVAPEAEKATIEPAEVVVINTDPRQAQQFAATVQNLGLSIKRRRTLKGLGLVVSVVRLPAGMRVSDALRQLRDQMPELWADANHRYTLQAGADPKTYARRLTGWDTHAGKCTATPRIGLVDTRVEPTHPALRGAHLVQKSFLPAGIKAAPPQHGTAVAALLAGRGHGNDGPTGLLPDAHLYIAAVFRSRGDDTQDTTAERIAYALNWLLEQHVTTVNLSLGGPRNLLVEAAIHRVLQTGVAVAAAAGNGGGDGKPVYPAAQQGVVAVTAVDANNRLYRHATHGAYIDFSAPGVDVWSASAKGGGAYFSGTSYAVPYVTATLATRHASLRARIDALSGSALDLGKPGRDSQFGWGLIQADGRCNATS